MSTTTKTFSINHQLSFDEEDEQNNSQQNNQPQNKNNHEHTHHYSTFVDIADHMSYEASIAVILLCCKKRVLYPYFRLISLLGWRPLFFTAVEPSCGIKFLNGVYLMFIIIVILMGHFLEYAACGHENPKFLHTLPSLFHICAYLTVLYYSRTPESERLETLMERVFLETSQNAGWLICHKKLLKKLTSFFIFCMTWVLVSLTTRLLHFLYFEAVYKHAMMCNYEWPPISVLNSALTAIRISCCTWNDLVCAAIVTTYSVYCQLNVSYIKNLCTVIRERRIPIQEFFKRVEEARNFVDYLNNDQAVGVSLLMMNLLCRMGNSFITLLHPQEGVKLSWMSTIVLTLTVLKCFCLIIVNLKTALELTNACKILRNIGHELKSMHSPLVAGCASEQADLDSLVTYTSSLDMEARILQIPIRASNLSFILISFTFILLLLAQFGYINF